MSVILHLTTLHPRSDPRIFAKEARTLAAHLPQRVVLMVADGKGNVAEPQGRVSIQDIGRLGAGRMGRMGRAGVGPWRAFSAIRKLKPAVVHFHDPELIPLGMFLKLMGYRVVYDVHEDVLHQISNKYWIPPVIRKPAAWATTVIEWIGARIFDAIVPATVKIARRFPTGKTVVVQNFPIITEMLQPGPVPYGERPPSFVYVGGISKIRGAAEMLRALELLGGGCGARLDLAGEFSPPVLEETLRALPGWASVNYHGYLSSQQVVQVLGRARAGLVLLHPLTNYVDSQPIKMFEYMAAGLPVIASNFPRWKQIIDGAGCGLLVDPLNPRAIADAMQWILDHPIEADAMGQRGRQAVTVNYSWDTEAAKLTGLYNRLLDVRSAVAVTRATILHVTTVHPRCDTRIFVKEAQTLAVHLPHKVVLMVADGEGPTAEEPGRVSVCDLGVPAFGRLGRAVLGFWAAVFAIARIKPEIVHFHDPELIPLGMLLRLFGYKVIYDVHEDVPRQILSKHWLPQVLRTPIAWIMSAVEWLGARVFHAIVPATPSIAGRFPAAKTVLVQNYPVADELLPAVPSPYAERSLSFVYPGVISHIRGAVEMVQAIERLGDIPGVRLDLAGPFDPADFIETLRALPGWKAVKYHGVVSRTQLAKLLGGARAGLVLHHPVPNEVDAQPIKMFEYMATGVPIIASDFRPLRRIIDGEGCGLIVDQSDPGAIAAAMWWILEHPAEAEIMGQRGRQAVTRSYDWDTEAAKLLDLYNKVLASNVCAKDGL